MHWKIFTDANTAEKASKILQKVIAQLGIEHDSEKVEPYQKGGFVCTFSSSNETSNWPQYVFVSLSHAQKIGHSWELSGNISEQLNIWSNNPSVPGVQNIHLVALNNA